MILAFYSIVDGIQYTKKQNRHFVTKDYGKCIAFGQQCMRLKSNHHAFHQMQMQNIQDSHLIYSFLWNRSLGSVQKSGGETKTPYCHPHIIMESF